MMQKFGKNKQPKVARVQRRTDGGLYVATMRSQGGVMVVQKRIKKTTATYLA